MDDHSNVLKDFTNVIYFIFLFAAESVEDVDAEGWVISSESCGFLSIGARYMREVYYYQLKINSAVVLNHSTLRNE